MKRTIKLLVLLVSFFTSLTITRAAINVGKPADVYLESVKNGYVVNGHPYYVNWEVHISNDVGYSKAIVWGIYYAKVDNRIMTAYCIDPKAATPTSVSTNKVVYVYGEGTEKSLSDRVYDAGVNEILSSGYDRSQKTSITIPAGTVLADKTTFSTSVTLQNYDYYFATNLALRAYIIGLFNRASGNDPNFLSVIPEAHTNQAIEWYNKATTEQITSLNKYIKKNLTQGPNLGWHAQNNPWYLKTNAKFTTFGKNGEDSILVAKYLFYKGLEAAKEEDVNSTLNTSIAGNSHTGDIIVTGNSRKVTRTITLTPQNFQKEGKISKLSVEFKPNSKITTSVSYKLNGSNVSSLNDAVINKDSKIEIIITAASSSNDCDPLHYEINYDYNDGVNFRSYLISAGGIGGGILQRLIAADFGAGHPIDKTEKQTGIIELCLDACETVVTVPTACTELQEDANAEWVTSSIEGPKNITKCVVGSWDDNNWTNKYDDAGNSYKSGACNSGTNKVVSNNYCAVYCKEDYDVIKFSGIKKATSGRYFKIGAEIEGKKSCYTSEIRLDQFNQDMKDLEIESKKVYDLYEVSKTSSLANQLTNLKKQYDKNIADINYCSSWTNEYTFDPVIEYNYDETQYMNLIKNQKDKQLVMKDKKITKLADWFCTGDLKNGEYTSCSSVITVNPTMSNKTFTIYGTGGKQTETKAISQAKYVKKETTASAKMNTPEIFYNVVPSGNVVIKENATNPNYQTELINGLPISIKTTVGQHNFSYNIKQLGEFYDSCNLGRLIGDKNSVVSKKTDENKYKFVGEYVCHYLVNCPDCVFTCETDKGDVCEWEKPPLCKDPNDKGCCPECSFTVENLAYYFRTISNKEIKPSEKPLGFNWNYEYNVEDTKFSFVTGKAKETVKGSKDGIESVGDAIYDKETPILTIELTPDMAKKVRDYNKSSEKDGGYSNNSITCYDYTSGGKTYKNIFCYSDFLDELKTTYSNNVSFDKTRLQSESQRKTNTTQNGYWNTYIQGMPVVSETTVGGPSWK